MKSDDVIAETERALGAKRVFGEPYEKNGITVITAASVMIGAGGGTGEGPGDQGTGSGSGYGMMARPVGAFVIRGEEVDWRPAVDVNRAILGGQIVAAIAFLTLRAVVGILARRKR